MIAAIALTIVLALLSIMAFQALIFVNSRPLRAWLSVFIPPVSLYAIIQIMPHA